MKKEKQKVILEYDEWESVTFRQLLKEIRKLKQRVEELEDKEMVRRL